MFKRILILSPHTDDAELGAGGSIAHFISMGCEVRWLVFSTCSESLPESLPMYTLAREFENAVGVIGLTSVNYRILNYPVRKLSDNRQDILEQLIKTRSEFHPDLVIGPSLHDYHQDHMTVATEMIRAFKTCASIICYELPWNHVEFSTQFFVRLSSEELASKVAMLEQYKSQQQKRQYFSEDFIRGLAATRGAQVGHPLAESFEVVRMIR